MNIGSRQQSDYISDCDLNSFFLSSQYLMDSHRSSYFPARSVLFRKEANGVTYRIPALIFLQHSSCFLAFCEERISPADSQAHLLVMRKGTFYRNYVEVGKEEATASETSFSFECIHLSYVNLTSPLFFSSV